MRFVMADCTDNHARCAERKASKLIMTTTPNRFRSVGSVENITWTVIENTNFD